MSPQRVAGRPKARRCEECGDAQPGCRWGRGASRARGNAINHGRPRRPARQGHSGGTEIALESAATRNAKLARGKWRRGASRRRSRRKRPGRRQVPSSASGRGDQFTVPNVTAAAGKPQLGAPARSATARPAQPKGEPDKRSRQASRAGRPAMELPVADRPPATGAPTSARDHATERDQEGEQGEAAGAAHPSANEIEAATPGPAPQSRAPIRHP